MVCPIRQHRPRNGATDSQRHDSCPTVGKAPSKGTTMTGNAPENPEQWARDYPPSKYTKLCIAEGEGDWVLVSAEEVGADV